MGPAQAIRNGFLRSFKFSGRASRSEFWWLLLATMIIGSAVNVLDLKLGLTPQLGHVSLLSIGAAWTVVTALPQLSVGFRRVQDIGYPGFLFLIIFAQIYLTFIVKQMDIAASPDANSVLSKATGGRAALVFTVSYLIVGIMRSQPGPNSYGPNPLEVTK